MSVASTTTPSNSAAVQKGFYEEHGYLLLPGLFDASEVAMLRAALDEVLLDAKGSTETTEKFAITTDIEGKPQVRRVFNPIVHHKAFRDAAHHRGILDVLENLIGPDIQIHHSKLNLKPPSTLAAQFPWHQDYPFFPHTNYDLLAVLIHIDEATEENGCLRIIPGSHKYGPRPHRFAGDGSAYTSSVANLDEVADETRWLSLPCPAGSVEMHHCNMLHSSTANLGKEPRSVLIIQYRAADNVALAGSRSPGFGTTVRGRDVHRARMLDGSLIELPPVINDPLQRDG
ncbi:MAG: phytanoyl-CoA dioxygenase family protein [Acidimicrobiales bacterium]